MSDDEDEPISSCELCGTVICEGDAYFATWDGDACERCSPSLSDLIEQYEEILSSVPWNGAELGYETRDDMKLALGRFKADLAMNGDRSLARKESAA